MPNKDFTKYNKGTSSLPMKAKGKPPLSPQFFSFFCAFFVMPKIIGGSKKKLYIFLRDERILKKSCRKKIFKNSNSNLKTK
jgi:hypothetical protein